MEIKDWKTTQLGGYDQCRSEMRAIEIMAGEVKKREMHRFEIDLIAMDLMYIIRNGDLIAGNYV